MLMAPGPKAINRWCCTRGGQQYRGFLEGRTQGDKYCLILHLSNMELKARAGVGSEGGVSRWRQKHACRCVASADALRIVRHGTRAVHERSVRAAEGAGISPQSGSTDDGARQGVDEGKTARVRLFREPQDRWRIHAAADRPRWRSGRSRTTLGEPDRARWQIPLALGSLSAVLPGLLEAAAK